MSKNRSKSAGPHMTRGMLDVDKDTAAAQDEIKSERKRGRHGQMVDLMTAEDRDALNLNKYEQAYTLAEL